MKQGTIAELAEIYKIKPTEMNGAIHFLLATGKAKLFGVSPKVEGQRGRASKIYQVFVEPEEK